jgi:hypothetical protein
LARSQYIETDRIKELLGKFCAAIGQKVQASNLEPGLKAYVERGYSRLRWPNTLAGRCAEWSRESTATTTQNEEWQDEGEANRAPQT